jgi:rRNA-processing protein FCF1
VQKVIFDSSFLIAVVERPTTWFEDITEGVGRFQPVLLECVEAELSRLSSREGSRARSARAALEMSSKFTRLPCGKAPVDDELVSGALSNKAVVATTDVILSKELRAAHVRTITLHSGRVHLD